VATPGVAAAALFGTAVVTLAVLGVDVLRSGFMAGAPVGRPPGGPAGSAAATLLLAGTLGGFVMAGATAWWLLAPIGSLYRRAVLALSSAFATVLLMLVAVPVHQLAGQPGLIGLAALLLAGGSACALRARRAARS
jgi:hypothetical protein